MNLKTALASPYLAKTYAHGTRDAKIKHAVMRALRTMAPRKPYDRDTARSMLAFNDIGGLHDGDIDTAADVAWLSNDVLRAMWNTAAALA